MSWVSGGCGYVLGDRRAVVAERSQCSEAAWSLRADTAVGGAPQVLGCLPGHVFVIDTSIVPRNISQAHVGQQPKV
ncbi:hypothetical protein LRQ04_11220 [Paenarthrobacter sp. AR 02]|nr:hypothetical protein [Paenarthrobacter sp. AR 02]